MPTLSPTYKHNIVLGLWRYRFGSPQPHGVQEITHIQKEKKVVEQPIDRNEHLMPSQIGARSPITRREVWKLASLSDQSTKYPGGWRAQFPRAQANLVSDRRSSPPPEQAYLQHSPDDPIGRLHVSEALEDLSPFMHHAIWSMQRRSLRTPIITVCIGTARDLCVHCPHDTVKAFRRPQVAVF